VVSRQAREQKRSAGAGALGGSLGGAATTSTIKRRCAVARSVFVVFRASSLFVLLLRSCACPFAYDLFDLLTHTLIQVLRLVI